MRDRMKIGKLAVVTVVVLSTVAARDVAPSKAELESMYDRAFRDLDAAKYTEALQELDAIDARKPDLAESQNLRGVVLMRQGLYDKAEAALAEAQRLDPKFWNAAFNLAEIPFQKKDWATARKRFQDLLSTNGSELESEAVQLIQYKILLTYLLEGNDAMVSSTLTKLGSSPDNAAVPYANAAIALQHQNVADARSWMATAEKSFSSPVNKLFSEPLVQIGWLQRKPGQQRPVVQLLTSEQRVTSTQAAARTDLEKAQQAYEQRDFEQASKLAEKVDADEPNQAGVLNLRGAIALEQQRFDEAEAFFNKALKIDKNLREAQINLADVPFRKKEYARARGRYEALARQGSKDDDQVSQLVKFKIFMTHLLEGKDSRAQKAMEQFQFSGDTPALYYAQAAWEFKHGNSDKANDWITSARKIYPLAANTVYGSGFYDLGWLKSAATVPSPAPTAATGAIASIQNYNSGPAIEPSPIPGAEAKTEEAAAPATNGTVAAAVSAAKPGNAAAPPAPTGAPFTSEAVTPPQAAQDDLTAAPASPSESRETSSVRAEPVAPAPVSSATVAPANASALTQPQPSAAPEVSVSAPAASVSATIAPVAAAPVAPTASPAVSLFVPAPAAPARESSESILRERLGQVTGPNPLLFALLALSGLGIIAWVGVSQVRRRPLVPHFGGAPATAAGPALRGPIEPEPLDEPAPRQFPGGPRHISVQLTAAEPSLRRAILPLGKREIAPAPEEGFSAGEPESSVGEVSELPSESGAVANPSAPAPAHRNGNLEKAAVPAFASRNLTERDSDFSESVGPVRELPPGDPIAPAVGISRANGRGLFGGRRSHSSFSGMPPAEPSVADDTGAASAGKFFESVGPVREQAPAEVHACAPDGAARNNQPETSDLGVSAGTLEAVMEVVEVLAVSYGSASGEQVEQPAPVDEELGRLSAAHDSSDEGSHASDPETPVDTFNVPSQPEPSFVPEAVSFAPPESTSPIDLAPPMLKEELAKQVVPVWPQSSDEQVPVIPEIAAVASGAPVFDAAGEQLPPASTMNAEPVDQGPPVPYLVTAQEQNETHDQSAEEYGAVPQLFTAPVFTQVANGIGALREAPAVVARETESAFNPQPTPTETMPETLQTPTAPVIRTPNPPPSQPNAHGAPPAAQPATAGAQTAATGVHTAVQITFSCEIASMQLTPTFKMGALQLRPTSKVVTMRLAPSQQQQQSAMNLQVNFEVAKVQPAPGSLGQIRLNPSQQQKPPLLSSPSFSISGLQLVSGFESAPVQLTPQQQGQASVQVTAAFQISTVEFSPGFDISGILLNAAGRTVSVQLPGAGASTIENAPLFEVANVQLTPNGDIAMLQLSPAGARRG